MLYKHLCYLLGHCDKNICWHILYKVTFFYTFQRKLIICTWVVCAETSPDGTIKLTTFLLEVRVAISLTNILLATTVFLLCTSLVFRIKRCPEFTSTKEGRASRKHEKSLSHSTNLLHSETCKYALAVVIETKQVSSDISYAWQSLTKGLA